mmetsp:Transcript_2399/g.9417  ORF Transcript_2399/g.9417 Transcript_2399/m.9417 type:complete len:397 (+) Transcript_2399:341-1531(+)
MRSEALAVHDAGAGLLVLLLGDPHLLEGGEGREDGAADPDGVLALGGSDHLDLHGGRGKGGHLLGEALGDAGVHGGAAGQHDVGVEVLADVHVARHDGVEGGLVDALSLLAELRRLEEGLGAAEALVADGHGVAVRELVRLLELGAVGGGGHLGVEVEGDVGEALLDVTHDLALGGRGEGVAALGEELHHVLGEVPAGEVDALDGVREGVALVDGHGVGHAVAGVKHGTGGAAGGVQGEHGLDVHVHGGHVEGLEHDLGHALAVGLGVARGLGEEDRVLLGGDAELVVEGVVPDLLHVVPVGHDAVLDGVLEGEHAALGLRLVAHIGILLVHADHHALVARAAHDGGEDGAGGVVAGEAGLAHAGPVVHHQRLHIFVGHCCLLLCFLGSQSSSGRR